MPCAKTVTPAPKHAVVEMITRRPQAIAHRIECLCPIPSEINSVYIKVRNDKQAFYRAHQEWRIAVAPRQGGLRPQASRRGQLFLLLFSLFRSVVVVQDWFTSVIRSIVGDREILHAIFRAPPGRSWNKPEPCSRKPRINTNGHESSGLDGGWRAAVSTGIAVFYSCGFVSIRG